MASDVLLQRLPDARRTDRLAGMILFVLVAAMTLWAGGRMVNRSLELRLVKDYLQPWQAILQQYRMRGLPWPVFDGHNHVAYMKTLANRLRHNGFKVPTSNTAVGWRYTTSLLGGPIQEIFVLGLEDRMVVFGLSTRTFRFIDRFVDGRQDSLSGRWTGQRGRNPLTFIGEWR